MRIAGLLAATILIVACSGCDQSGQPEGNAELEKMNAEMAATNSDLAEAQAELADAKADFDSALREREIDISLPELLDAQPLSNKTVVIDVIEDGKYKIQDEQWDTEQLTEFLHQLQLQDPGSAVLIRGDAKLEFRCIVRVMDLCNSKGLHNFSVATIETE